MSREFLNAFKDSKECQGIKLSAGGDKARSDFRVITAFMKADTPEMEEEWAWTVFDTRHDAKGEFRGSGNEASPADAVRAMCVLVSENFK
jgi:hypothetical protein